MNISLRWIRKDEFYWDDGVSIKLLTKFLKKHHCMHRIYPKISGITLSGCEVSMFYPNINRLPVLYLMFGKDSYGWRENGGIPTMKDLILSQLWKFYVLDNIDLFPKSKQEEIKNLLIYQLKINGYRNDKGVKKLFIKHNLEPEPFKPR